MNKVVIKKYPNRRLYDTKSSSYISLNDIFQMVKKGIDFKVIDNKTKEEVTKSILIQIIFEQEAKGYNLLPITFLKQIINCYQIPQSSYLEDFTTNLKNGFNIFYAPFNQEEK